METLLKIDGKSIEEMGIYLLEGSYQSLLQYPSLKSIEKNDWAEYDGIEADLFNPTLNIRSVNLNFYAKGGDAYLSFLKLILANGYKQFYFPKLGITRQFRLDVNSVDDYENTYQVFSLTFIDDTPSTLSDGSIVPQTWLKQGEVIVDNTNLSTYGISILEGTYKSLLAIPKTKQRLLVNENSMNGAIYDIDGDPHTGEQKCSLKLFMRADNVDNLVKNFYGFLHYLVQPLERTLILQRQYNTGNTFVETTDVFLFYYESQSVSDVILKGLSSGFPAIIFDLNICITEREIDTREYLVDDEAEFVLTTDNNVKLIIG